MKKGLRLEVVETPQYFLQNISKSKTMLKVNQKPDFSGHTIYVGIDVHANSWNVSLYCDQQYLKTFNQPPSTKALHSFLFESYPGALYKCAYESGFCGYWIQRSLQNFNIDCVVVNAADIPQTDKGIKSKTDKNDSKRIAQGLQAGLLEPIYIPDDDLEADRLLVRCNERFNADLTRAKNRIKSFLYQLGIRLPENFANSNWSNQFIQWLDQLKLNNGSATIALRHQVAMVKSIRIQKLAVLRDIRNLLKKDRYEAIANRLMTTPGVGPLTAAALVTEIHDIRRFSTFKQLNSFVGFYPSQFSSGENIHHGKLTTRKHRRLRTLLVEAAWMAIRSDPAMTKAYADLKKRIGPKRAIVRIARKLLSKIRAVWITNTEYQKGIL